MRKILTLITLLAVSMNLSGCIINKKIDEAAVRETIRQELENKLKEEQELNRLSKKIYENEYFEVYLMKKITLIDFKNEQGNQGAEFIIEVKNKYNNTLRVEPEVMYLLINDNIVHTDVLNNTNDFINDGFLRITVPDGMNILTTNIKEYTIRVPGFVLNRALYNPSAVNKFRIELKYTLLDTNKKDYIFIEITK